MKRAIAIAMLLAGCRAAPQPTASDAGAPLVVTAQPLDPSKLPGAIEFRGRGGKLIMRKNSDGSIEVIGERTADPSRVLNGALMFARELQAAHLEQLEHCVCGPVTEPRR